MYCISIYMLHTHTAKLPFLHHCFLNKGNAVDEVSSSCFHGSWNICLRMILLSLSYPDTQRLHLDASGLFGSSLRSVSFKVLKHMVTDLCCTTFCPKPAASDFKSDRHICHIYLILGLSTWKLQIKATPSLSWQIGYSRINMTTRFNYLHKWDIRFTICSLRPSMTRHWWVLAAWLWIRGAPWLLPEALP